MKKISILALSILTLTVGCQRGDEENSFLYASGYPASCDNDPGLNGLISTLNICANPTASDDFSLNCLNGARDKYDALSSTCRNDARKVFASALAKMTIASISNSIKSASANAGWPTSVNRVVAAWSKTGAGVYAEDQFDARVLTGEVISTNLGLASVSAELLKGTSNLASVLYVPEKDGTSFAELSSLQMSKLLVDYLSRYNPQTASTTDDLYLATLLFHSFKSFESEVEVLARLRDATCSVATCSESRTRDYQAFITILGKFGQSDFPSVVAASSSLFDSERVTLLNALVQSNNAIGQALTKIAKRESTKDWNQCLDDGVLLNSKNPSVRDLASLMGRFRVMERSFKQTGFYYDTKSNTLLYGFSPKVAFNLNERLKAVAARLTSSNESFQKARQDSFDSLKALVSAQTSTVDVAYQVDSLNRRIDRLGEDISGLKSALIGSEKSFAAYNKSIEEMAKKGTTGAYLTETLPVKTATGNSIKYKGGSPGVSDIAFDSYDMEAGEVLNIRASGRWSPVCALAKSPRFAKVASSRPKVFADGFDVSISNGTESVTSREHRSEEYSYSERSSKTDSCVGSSTSTGIGANLFSVIHTDTSVNSSQNICLSSSAGLGHKTSDADVSSQSQRATETASFSTGLVLLNTPAPEYTAGSILAVVFPENAANPATAMRVEYVSANTSIVAREKTKVYLVANDCGDQDLTQVGSITLEGARLKPKNLRMAAILASFVKTLEQFDIKALKLLDEGSDLNAQLQILQDNTLSDFSRGNEEIGQIPGLSDTLRAWIANEGLKISRKAQIMSKIRELDLLLVESQRLQELDKLSRSAAYLSQVRLKQALDDLDVQPIRLDVTESAIAVAQRILPVLKFYNTDFSLANDSIAERQKAVLSKLGIKIPVRDASVAFVNLLGQVSSVIDINKDTLSNRNFSTTIGIFIPNPEFVGETGSDQTVRNLPKLDKRRSETFWSAMFGTGKAYDSALTLNSEDLYIPSASDFSLFCAQHKPVITNTALGVVLSGSTASNDVLKSISFTRMPVHTGPLFRYADQDGPKDFRLENDSDGTGIVSVGFFQNSNFADGMRTLLSNVKLDTSGALSGLSPFADFRFDPAPFRTQINTFAAQLGTPTAADINEVRDPALNEFFGVDNNIVTYAPKYPKNIQGVLLAFEVSYVLGGDINWLPSCQAN